MVTIFHVVVIIMGVVVLAILFGPDARHIVSFIGKEIKKLSRR
jgi:hypothetical protein